MSGKSQAEHHLLSPQPGFSRVCGWTVRATRWVLFTADLTLLSSKWKVSGIQLEHTERLFFFYFFSGWEPEERDYFSLCKRSWLKCSYEHKDSIGRKSEKNPVEIICTSRKSVSSTVRLVIQDKYYGQSSSEHTISNNPVWAERCTKLSSSSNCHANISVTLVGWGEEERQQDVWQQSVLFWCIRKVGRKAVHP